MKNSFFHNLYMTIRQVRVKDCSAKSLSHLLHGYLSVYAMVRVSPALEREYGTLEEIHGRVRDIAEELFKGMNDISSELDERIGYVADLMDAYQTYSDMDILDEGLDAGYRILFTGENGEIVLPGKTPNVCRLLCNWYYFTGEERCLELAMEVTRGHGEKSEHEEDRWKWFGVMVMLENLSDSNLLDRAGVEAYRQERGALASEVDTSPRGETWGLERESYLFEVLAAREGDRL